MSAPAYPKRPPFFAYRFCRLLAKVCLANEIGPEACWMLTIIAHTEDAKGYRGPVTYFNEQLFPIVGLGSVSSLLRVREKCVTAGWLTHIPGTKGKAAQYWVNIPKQFEGVADSATDEKPSEYKSDIPSAGDEQSGEKAERKRKATGKKAEGNRKESGELSSLSQDNLSQDTHPPPPPGADGAGAESVETPKPRNLLFDAIAEVTQKDPSVKKVGAEIGRVSASLAKAKPPYTPEDVFEFGRRYQELCPWAAGKGYPRPTPGIIESNIALVRAKPPPRQHTGPKSYGQQADDRFASLLQQTLTGDPPQ